MESFSINGVVQAEYKYNYLGQQAIRTLTQTGQVINSVYGPDGNRMAEFEYDPVSKVSSLLREYVWFEGKPIAVIEGGVVYYVRSDHIGRPVFATDSTGTKVWEATYLPFGGVHTSSGNNIALRFPRQWFQSESGLHQNWMRDYDPTTGRYIQADPLGLVDGASVYGYAGQNPGRYVDPRGEQIVIPRPFFPIEPVIPKFGPFGGLVDLPPLILPRENTSENFVDHPIAKEEYRKYKDYCRHPPPKTGDRCTDLLKRAEYLFQCAKMRDDWDKKWLPGRHKKSIAEIRIAAQRNLAKYYRSCASCNVGEPSLPTAPKI